VIIVKYEHSVSIHYKHTNATVDAITHALQLCR